jgi:hypothetical protein
MTYLIVGGIALVVGFLAYPLVARKNPKVSTFVAKLLSALGTKPLE